MKPKILKAVSVSALIALMISAAPSVTAKADETEQLISEYTAEENVPESVQTSELHFGENTPEYKITGNVAELKVYGYEDSEKYLFGESPFEFFTDNESIAVITAVHGNSVYIQAISAGSAVITAKAPDGRTAYYNFNVTEPGTAVTVNTGVKTPGDLNNDKKINVADLVKMRLMIKNKEAYSHNADMNKDGVINVFDIVILKRIILCL